MPIHFHTPTADYGLSLDGLQGGGSFQVMAVNGATYNMLGEDLAGPGATPAANCFTGPAQIIAVAGGAANLRLNCQTGLAAHADRFVIVAVQEVGGNPVTVLDSNGAAVGTGAVLNAGGSVFIYTNNTWYQANS